MSTDSTYEELHKSDLEKIYKPVIDKFNVKKTDSSSLSHKLNLRRHVLERYFDDIEIKVLDCCQGEGEIWGVLRKEFEIDSYFGIDLKYQSGRLTFDSARLLDTGIASGFTVVDIDSYGRPWNHWASLLPHIEDFTVVFLTVGGINIQSISKYEMESMGVPLDWYDRVPQTIMGRYKDFSLVYCIDKARELGLEIVEAIRVDSYAPTVYAAVILEPV